MIVVTTPTGQIGHHVGRHLIDAGEAVRVVARDPGKLPPAVSDRVEVIEGSHGDAAVMDRALAGAEALFWLSPPTPRPTLDAMYVDLARPAVEAIRRHGVGRVVAVTVLGRGTPWQDRAGLVTASLKMMDLLYATGAAVRGLAMPAFMENALQQLPAIRAGGMYGPVDPDSKLPHTATRDMGAAAARLLLDRSWTGQEDAPLLGPEDLSYADLAAIVSDLLGREVRYQQIPFEAAKAQMIGHGTGEAFAQGYVDMMRAKNEGMDNMVVRAPDNTGPTSFRQWAEEVLKPAIEG